MTTYRTGDIVRLVTDGGTFAGRSVIIRAVIPRLEALGNMYVVHPPREPGNKRDVPHHRIAELVEPNPLPPLEDSKPRIMLHVPEHGRKDSQPMTIPTPTHIPPLTLSDDMDPLAKAEHIEAWIQSYERTPVQAAHALNVSRSTIDNYRLLLRASEDLKARIRAREINMYKALNEIKETKSNPVPAPAEETPIAAAQTPEPIQEPVVTPPQSNDDLYVKRIQELEVEAAYLTRDLQQLQYAHEDLLEQRNAAEETVRRYAAQSDSDKVLISEWEHLCRNWNEERATLLQRLQALESQPSLIAPAQSTPPRIHITVANGGILHLVGGVS